ncbi:MAG: hypothetical protein HYU86_10790 [Chloroflexi bacterium]|nr:hypothetical protein [Chloroflexota bacterium]
MPLVIRPGYIFSYLWLGINWRDAAVLLSVSLMVLVLITGFWSLKDSLA